MSNFCLRNKALPLIALHHYLIMTPIIAPQAARPFNPDNALCKRTHYECDTVQNPVDANSFVLSFDILRNRC
jgi:hypothetical protein